MLYYKTNMQCYSLPALELVTFQTTPVIFLSAATFRSFFISLFSTQSEILLKQMVDGTVQQMMVMEHL